MTVVCVTLLTFAASIDAEGEYRTVAAAALAARQPLGGCKVQLRWTRTWGDGSRPTERRQYVIWSSGRKLRIDELPKFEITPDAQRQVPGRHIVCRNCQGDDLDTDHYTYQTSVRTEKSGVLRPGIELGLVVDPRALGMNYRGLHDRAAATLGTGLHDPNWVDRRAVPDPAGRPGVVLLTATEPGWGTTRCWIDTGRDHSPIRFECTGGYRLPGAAADTPVVVTHDVELARDAVSGRWFPARLRYRDQRDGRPYMDEEVEVVAAEIDRPIDPAVFTLVGFDLAEGTPVLPLGVKKGQYWNGREVTADRPFREAEVVLARADHPPRPVTPPSPVGRWLTVAGAVATAGVGVWLLRRAWRG